MRVFGVDPGSITTGYSIVEEDNRGKPRAVGWGGIKAPNTLTFPEKIKYVYDALFELIKNHSPDTVAVEEVFFAKNPKSVLKLSQVRGAILVCAANLSINIVEYSALEVKQTVVGYGRAEKTQVREMVKRLLQLKNDPSPIDASDALAVAICHLSSYKFRSKIELLNGHLQKSKL